MFLLSIQIDISPNILVIERNINNTTFAVISAILGSVAGLLALFGNAVKFSEKSLDKVKNKIRSQKEILKLKEKRKDLLVWQKNQQVRLDDAMVAHEKSHLVV